MCHYYWHQNEYVTFIADRNFPQSIIYKRFRYFYKDFHCWRCSVRPVPFLSPLSPLPSSPRPLPGAFLLLHPCPPALGDSMPQRLSLLHASLPGPTRTSACGCFSPLHVPMTLCHSPPPCLLLPMIWPCSHSIPSDGQEIHTGPFKGLHLATETLL